LLILNKNSEYDPLEKNDLFYENLMKDFVKNNIYEISNLQEIDITK